MDALRRVLGSGGVEKEPSNYRRYADHRPDMCTEWDGFRIWDLKMLDSIGSAPGESLAQRAAAVAFGTTIESRHHTHIRGRVARVLLGSHTFAPYSHAEISSEVV